MKKAKRAAIFGGVFTILAGLGLGYLVELLGGIPSKYEIYVSYVQYAIYALGAINILLAFAIKNGFARFLIGFGAIISLATGINIISGILNLVGISRAKKAIKLEKEEAAKLAAEAEVAVAE